MRYVWLLFLPGIVRELKNQLYHGGDDSDWTSFFQTPFIVAKFIENASLGKEVPRIKCLETVIFLHLLPRLLSYSFNGKASIYYLLRIVLLVIQYYSLDADTVHFAPLVITIECNFTVEQLFSSVQLFMCQFLSGNTQGKTSCKGRMQFLNWSIPWPIINQPFAVVPALHSVLCKIRHVTTTGTSFFSSCVYRKCSN